jgi:hypothetical protein
MEAQARAVVATLAEALAASGVKSVMAPRNPFGAGLGVLWDVDEFTVLSVMIGDLEIANLGSAVLRGVARERAAILDITNRLTRDNPLMPVVLHDAEAGWDVLVTQRFPVQLLLENRRFLRDCVESLSGMAKQTVAELAPFGGRRPRWTAEDLHELVTRTMM